MTRALFIIVLVALLVSVPVAIKYSIDAKHLRNDLTAQTEAATAVSTELAQVSDSLKSKTDQIGALTDHLDSLSRLYAQASTRANQLSNKVAMVSKTVDSLKALSTEHAARFEEQGKTLSGVRIQLAETSQALTDTRNQLAAASALLKERTALFSQLQPWYTKWKHDATERNWLEKLFGADKATAPSVPEPVFPAAPVDSVRSDPAAKLPTAF